MNIQKGQLISLHLAFFPYFCWDGTLELQDTKYEFMIIVAKTFDIKVEKGHREEEPAQ